VSAHRRTPRDKRRLGQNFLHPWFADRLVAEADFRPAELVVEIGAGLGAITLALAHRGLDVVAVEVDPVCIQRLRASVRSAGRVRIVQADFLTFPLPTRPFRVMGSLPFGETTGILRRLLDNPSVPLERADLIVQWEVACKRAAVPPSTLLSTVWAPWWEFRLGRRIPAAEFRPIPHVDAGMLIVMRRDRPILPPAMAAPWAAFVRSRWPLDRASVS